MNILYLIFEKQKDKPLSKETKKSISLKKNDKFEFRYFEDPNDFQLYYKLLEDIDLNNINYICLLPNGSILENNYRKIIDEYIIEEDLAIYLPFVLLVTKEIKGILNSTLFNANLAFDFGKLDFELALKQTDTILFGALIPLDLLKDKKSYNEELKIYQHFHLLNDWTKKEKNIIGIPKLLLELNYDLSFNNYTEEEKINYYKKAREKFIESI